MDERKHRRRPVEIGCWLVDDDSASCYYTFEISETGLSVATTEPLPVGRVVRLQFFTPQSASALTLEAEVVWSRVDPEESGMGLRFLALDDGMRLIIAEFTELMRQKALEQNNRFNR